MPEKAFGSYRADDFNTIMRLVDRILLKVFLDYVGSVAPHDFSFIRNVLLKLEMIRLRFPFIKKNDGLSCGVVDPDLFSRLG
jgi:hypothetical protein